MKVSKLLLQKFLQEALLAHQLEQHNNM